MTYSNSFVGAALVAVGEVMLTRGVCFRKALSGPFDGVIIDAMAKNGVDKEEAAKHLECWADNIDVLLDSDPDARTGDTFEPVTEEADKPERGNLLCTTVNTIVAHINDCSESSDVLEITPQQVIDAWMGNPDAAMIGEFEDAFDDDELIDAFAAKGIPLLIPFVVQAELEFGRDFALRNAIKEAEKKAPELFELLEDMDLD